MEATALTALRPERMQVDAVDRLGDWLVAL